MLAQEIPGQTLEATALVHEAYVLLVDLEEEQKWKHRGHFFAAKAEAMRRNGKIFTAGFRDPAQPEDVAQTILEAITCSEYRLRWPVGKDAVSFYRGRRTISDEDWVAMGDDLSDQEYNQRFADYFGIKL